MGHRFWLTEQLDPELEAVADSFTSCAAVLDGAEVRTVEAVREIVAPALRDRGWTVACGRRSQGGIAIAAVRGPSVRADAFHAALGAGLWIETGRGWTNNAFLHHAVLASVSDAIQHVIVALRSVYEGTPAFDHAVEVLDQVIGVGRIRLPYRSLTLIGF